MSVIEQLEFEITSFDAAVQYFNHYAMRTLRKMLYSIAWTADN